MLNMKEVHAKENLGELNIIRPFHYESEGEKRSQDLHLFGCQMMEASFVPHFVAGTRR